jgi:hypothetical protein
MPKKADITKLNYLNSDSKLLKLDLMTNFYNKPENLRKIIDVVVFNKDHALRVLEWFCNNYTKKNNIIYKVTPTKEINVYLDYKACLDSYSKKKFDPYKRLYEGYGTFEINVNIPEIPTLKKFETTVAQLNFFRWCIKNKILDYVKTNMETIRNDMNVILKKNYPKEPKEKKEVKKTRKKRTALSVSATLGSIKNPSNNKTIRF